MAILPAKARRRNKRTLRERLRREFPRQLSVASAGEEASQRSGLPSGGATCLLAGRIRDPSPNGTSPFRPEEFASSTR